jgi:hypothetical protein
MPPSVLKVWENMKKQHVSKRTGTILDYVNGRLLSTGLWYKLEEYGKAAGLFERAKLFGDASRCYHLKGSYDEAVESLRRGNSFDDLVIYLSQ